MSAIPGIVAVNTFREAVRDRVLYNLVFFALLMIGAAILVGQISIGISRLVIINLGLSAISIFGLVMAVFIGVGLVYKEMERRTLYSLLSKPVRRWQFLVGKYAGLLLTLVVNTSLMTLALAAALFYVGRPFVRADASIGVAVYFILLQLALVTAIALFFSCFSSPMLSTLFTLGIYVTGVFASDIRDFGDLTRSAPMKLVTRIVYYLVPNFHNFNGIAAAAHGDSIPSPLILQDTLYAVLYVAVALLGASAVFFTPKFEMMTFAQNRPAWTAAACVPLLFIAIASLQVRIDGQTRSAAQAKEELLLRSGAALKKLSLGYDSLLADIYWTRAVQYYGTRVGTRGAKFDLLWPLLDVTTTLDPHLMPAYQFGAIFLSEPGDAGAGRTDLAIQLVKRGIAANPSAWRLQTDLAFLYYWRLRDYPDAAAAYMAASRNPEAPGWLSLMAARIAQKGGSIETSRVIWSELYRSTKDPSVQKEAVRQLHSLAARDDEAHLDDAAGEYRARFGHFPASLEEMRAAGLLPGIPVDPAGFPYVLGADGKSHLSPASPVVILPDPQVLAAP